MKILINTTHPDKVGGVSNHYKGLEDYWRENIQYNYIGHRFGVPGAIIFVFDIFKFIYRCLKINPDLIVLNPSLGKTAIFRDGIFLKISKLLRFKTIVFFHGWDEELSKRISQAPEEFVRSFNRSDAFLVLASQFREQMIQWGISKPIYLTTTKVEDRLVDDFDIDLKECNRSLLFLSRVEEYKGIFIVLKAFVEISNKIPNVKLIVAGSGSALPEAKKYVSDNNLKKVEFKGFIDGKELIKTFKQSDIYILPSFGEGMPTAVLEAMAFGLPIITRPVGGLVDFFEDKKMGFLIDSLEPIDFAEKVIELIKNEKKQIQVSHYNYNYALRNFLASEVAKSLEQIFKKILNKQPSAV